MPATTMVSGSPAARAEGTAVVDDEPNWTVPAWNALFTSDPDWKILIFTLRPCWAKKPSCAATYSSVCIKLLTVPNAAVTKPLPEFAAPVGAGLDPPVSPLEPHPAITAAATATPNNRAGQPVRCICQLPWIQIGGTGNTVDCRRFVDKRSTLLAFHHLDGLPGARSRVTVTPCRGPGMGGQAMPANDASGGHGVGLAVIGCGTTGRIRARLASENPGVRWLGLCDLKEDLAAALAADTRADC